MAPTYHVGQRVSFDSQLCTVRYIGTVAGTQKDWLGVEWDDPTRGKHDGEYEGVKYFSCRSGSKTAASFIRPSRIADPVQSFVEAVHQKYASELIERRDAVNLEKEIEISGKVVEEVGFQKIRIQLAQLHELKIVIVDGLRIACSKSDERTIKDVCPKITELDLSRNLFESYKEIMNICRELDNLQTLKLNGNRLGINLEHLLPIHIDHAFKGVKDLSLDEMLITWEEACLLVNTFPTLATLSISSNELSLLQAPAPLIRSMSTSGLKSLTLDYNAFSCLADLAPLAAFPALEKLHLKGNQIRTISDGIRPIPIFGKQLYYVDLSYNDIRSWDFIDDLPDVFPSLTALRFSHNPVYDNIVAKGTVATAIEEGYMLTLARLANLKVLNFSNITPADRTNAEMFYLSRIGKAMATVSESEEHTIASQHRRLKELSELYGAPAVVRAGPAINPDFLEARLIKFTFHIPPRTLDDVAVRITKVQEIPKSFDVYQVKGIVGRLFGLWPLRLRLIWETGEWDPVAGYEDEEEDSDDEDDRKDISGRDELLENGGLAGTSKGRYMKREVELENGTRQIGFWIDGMEATVRVEVLPDSRA